MDFSALFKNALTEAGEAGLLEDGKKKEWANRMASFKAFLRPTFGSTFCFWGEGVAALGRPAPGGGPVRRRCV